MAGIKEELELGIDGALRDIKRIDAEMVRAAQQFKVLLADATSPLRNVKAEIDTQSVQANIDKVTKDTTVKVKATVDTTQATQQLNLFEQREEAEQLELDLQLDTTQAVAAAQDFAEKTDEVADRAERNWKKIGQGATDVGKKLSAGITLPVVAVGVAGVKLGQDFETAFSRMVGLANVPAEEVERLRQGVLGLSGETTRSPQELAEALYFIASSGIASSDALDVLEASAKASAAGLGQTQIVADAVTSATNAYGLSNLSAAEATDILTAAVREGKGEADSFAGTMGRVVPTAAALGVGFEQVAGVLAVMTRTGLSTEEAATSLNQVFTSLLNTTDEGERVLTANHLSLKQLRDIAAQPGGVVQVMRLLDAAFAGNIDQLELVIPNVRALRGFLNVLAQDADLVDTVMQNVANSTGATNEAFGAFAQTSAFETQQAKATIEAALIAIGTAMVPLIEGVAGLAKGFADFFSSLPPGAQTAILVLAGLAATVGPLLLVVGSLIRNFQLLASTLPRVAAALGASAGPFIILAAVVGGVAYAFYRNAQDAAEARRRVQEYTSAIRETGEVAAGVTKVLDGMFEKGKNEDLLEALDLGNVKLEEFANAVAAGGSELDAIRLKLLQAFAAENVDEGAREEIERMTGKTLPELVESIASGTEAWKLYKGTSPTPDTAAAVAELEKLNKTITTQGSEVAKATEKADRLNRVLGEEETQATDTSDALATLPPNLQDIIDNAGNASFATGALTNALDTLASGVVAASQRVADGAAAILSGIGSAAEAYTQLESEANKADKATGGTAKTQKSAEDTAKAVARATDQYTESLERVAEAQEKVVDAQRDLDEALKGPSQRDKREAQLDLADATDEVSAANQRVREAQKKLDEARAEGDLEAVVVAQRELAAAARDVERAQFSLEDQTKATNEVLNFNATTNANVQEKTEELNEAQKNLTQVLKESEDAFNGIADAANNATEAQGGTARSVREDVQPTLEQFTQKMRENVQNQILFFENIRSLVERGADDLARSILEVASTDKQAAGELAAQATQLTDDRLTEQERLVEETNRKAEEAKVASRGLYEELVRGAGEASAEVPRLIHNSFELVRAQEEDARSSGRTVGEGIGQGVEEGVGGWIANIKEAARKSIRAAKEAMEEEGQIKSPSRVFMEIGSDLGAGLAVGIARERESALRAAAGLVQAAASGASAEDGALTTVGRALTDSAVAAPVGTVLDSKFDQFLALLAEGGLGVTYDLDFNTTIDNVTSDDAEATGENLGAAATRMLALRGIALDARRGVKR